MHQLKISRSHLIFHLLTKKGKVVRNVPALYLFRKRVYMYQVLGVHASSAWCTCILPGVPVSEPDFNGVKSPTRCQFFFQGRARAAVD